MVDIAEIRNSTEQAKYSYKYISFKYGNTLEKLVDIEIRNSASFGNNYVYLSEDHTVSDLQFNCEELYKCDEDKLKEIIEKYIEEKYKQNGFYVSIDRKFDTIKISW